MVNTTRELSVRQVLKAALYLLFPGLFLVFCLAAGRMSFEPGDAPFSFGKLHLSDREQPSLLPDLAAVIRGPYLQIGTPTSITIRWRTDSPVEGTVWYGTDRSNMDEAVTEGVIRTDHEVILSGLTPNTRYFYAVGTEADWLAGGTEEHFFHTSPPHGTTQPVRIWVLGDPGSGNSNARAVRDGYYQYADTAFTDLILTLGDNAYSQGTDAQFQKGLFENMYEQQLVHSVIWPSPGDHDYESIDLSSKTGPYYEVFTLPQNGEAGGLPSGAEAYYSFDYANIHFVSLDANETGRDPGDPMLVWLEKDLAATRQDWIIAYFHQAPYSKGSHDSDQEKRLIDMRTHVLPILEAAKVDLVLTGHSHAYERSYLLEGHYGYSGDLQPELILDQGDGRIDGDGAYQKSLNPSFARGTVYVVAGSSGRLEGGPLDHPAMYYSREVFGSVSVEIKGNQLDLNFIGIDGKVLDYFTIQKTVPAGALPIVDLRAPSNRSYFATPGEIRLQAQASDSDGTIETVDFFVDGLRIGSDATTPYSINWMIPSSGTFDISAGARDDDGNLTISSTSRIQVGEVEVCAQVYGRNNDAEESDKGVMSLTSSDLELVNDGQAAGNQLTAVRFGGLDIPPGAGITGAFIQFTVREIRNSDPCRLRIFGEAGDAPAVFIAEDGNISKRPRTEAYVEWSPPLWLEPHLTGPDQQTPDLKAVLQEIVTREGYASTDAVVFIFEGVGRRPAEAYDGIYTTAPQLCVTYINPCLSGIDISASADEVCAGQEVILTAGPAAKYLWDSGDTTASIRAALLENTVFRLTAWGEDRCQYNSQTEILVHPLPEIEFPRPIRICPQESISLTPDDDYESYNWSAGSQADLITVNKAGTYALTVTDLNGCEASAVVEVGELAAPEFTFSPDTLFYCRGDSIRISGPAGDFYYQWSSGDTSISVLINTAGKLSLRVTNADGCATTSSVEVLEHMPPDVELEFDQDSLRVSGLEYPTDYTFLWSTGAVEKAIEVTTSGNYCVTVTDPLDCSSTACIDLIVSGGHPVNYRETLEIAPNPFRLQLFVKPLAVPGQVLVFDLMGRPVAVRMAPAGDQLSLWFDDLPSGVYFIYVVDERSAHISRVIKQ